MKTAPARLSFQLTLDQRRRPTLPSELLEEAGISIHTLGLVAYSDQVGRIILADPMALLNSLGEQVLAGMRERGNSGAFSELLFEERASDTSLDD